MFWMSHYFSPSDNDMDLDLNSVRMDDKARDNPNGKEEPWEGPTGFVPVQIPRYQWSGRYSSITPIPPRLIQDPDFLV